jgi:hypothetical protein
MRHNSNTDLMSQGRWIQIPLGIKLITSWLFQQPPQIQHSSHHQSQTVREAEKSTWSGTEKTTKEIQQEDEEEIACAAHLARELDQARDRGKRHNGLQDDSGASDDEPKDGAPTRRHHPKFNSERPTNRDRLRNWS